MDAIRGLVARLRALWNGNAADADLAEEMRFHIEMETARNAERGMSPDAARRKAALDFGGMQRARDQHRDARGVRWTEEVLADAKYAVRALRHAPGITAAAIATLALGIGATTAIFSAVNAVIVRPLPFPNADRLVMAWESNPERGWVQSFAAPANYLDWKSQVASFESAAAYADLRGQVTWTGDGDARLLNVVRVTPNFLSTLGLRPQIGRDFTPEELWYKPRYHVALLSDRAWHAWFGGDRRVVGRTGTLSGRTVQIVGVMPPGFAYPWSDLDVWTPLEFDQTQTGAMSFRRAHWLRVVARLAPGVSPERANTELAQVARRLEHDYPQTNTLMGAGVTPLHTYLIGDTRRPLMLLLVAVGFLLVLACANVANLLLVHAASRQRETTMRLALGAGRYRLVRQALTESLVLSAAGGLLGLGVGALGTRAFVALQPAGMLSAGNFSVDWRVLAFITAVTTMCGILFGIAPALWNRTRDPAEVLKDGGRSTASRRGRRWDDLLVVIEVAVALVLTAGAGLLTRSFMELRATDPGFKGDGVLTAKITAVGVNFQSGDAVAAFFDELVRRASTLPGVDAASATSGPPLAGLGYTSDFIAQGRPVGGFGIDATHRSVTPGYFRTMGVRLLAGRDFNSGDASAAARVTIINESLARQYFRGENPIGQRITFDRVPDSTSTWRTIVGVSADERQTGYGTPAKIEFIEPLAQQRTSLMYLMLHSKGDPMTLAPEIRRLVKELDPTLAVQTIEPMNAIADRSLAKERFLMALLVSFAVVGLSLSVIGVYGVVSQLARRRRHEMGVRLALGARNASVQWMIVRHGAAVVAIGLVAGGLISAFASRGLAGMLYRVSPFDPLTFGVVSAVLFVAAVGAAWIPALRAGRLDPLSVLREE